MHNGATRKDHETIDNSDLPKLFAIQINFFTMNKNYVYNTTLLDDLGLDGYLSLPLTNEKI